MAKRECLRCGRPLTFVERQYIQLGKASGWTQLRSNIIAGALDTEIWVCLSCGEYSFFRPGNEEDDEDASGAFPQVKCEGCGAYYDFDEPKCPNCGRAADLTGRKKQ